MEADELFQHALTSLPEAAGDLLRDGRDPGEFVFATFDGSSDLGKALLAADVAEPDDDDAAPPSVRKARVHVEQMVREARSKGEELVVSLMLTPDALTRMLTVSNVTPSTRLAVGAWLANPLAAGHFRVMAIAGEQVRAATVDGVSDLDDAPVSSSMLN